MSTHHFWENTMGMTAEDFTNYRLRAESMSMDQLLFARNDAREAMVAQKGNNPIGSKKGEGWYTDEMCTYSDEIRRRTK